MAGAARRDLRRDRRRRPDRGHRRVRQARASRRARSSACSRSTPTRWRARSPRAGASTLPHVGLFADGVAVKQVGKETFRIARKLVDEIVLVDTDATCAALKDVFEDTRSILEPAGALAIAGVKAWVERHRTKDRTYVAIACGANMNFDRLRFVAERAELGEAARGDPRGDDPRAAGQLPRVLRAARQALGHRVQLPLRRRRRSRTCSSASRSRAGTRRDQLLAELKRRRIEAFDLSDNEMAKLHVRHLVGGHAPSARERDPLPLRVSRAARAR